MKYQKLPKHVQRIIDTKRREAMKASGKPAGGMTQKDRDIQHMLHAPLEQKKK